MKLLKTIAYGACFMLIGTVAFAQSQSMKSSNETSVEDIYLNSVQDVIITELANSQDYDNKLVALQYLEDSVKGGKVSDEQKAALKSLAGEGITTRVRQNGRLMNNFPDIRAKACDLLGEIKTEDSKNALLTILTEDAEPMVASAAVRSLGNIGINNNDEVLSAIEFIQHKYAALNPTSSFAFEILDAYEKLAPTAQDKRSMIESVTEIASNYRFATPVRLKALTLLKNLQSENK